MEEVEDFPLQYFYDVRESIVRIRVENTHLEEDELFDLRRSLSTIDGIVKILNHSDDDEAEQEDGWRREKKYPYPLAQGGEASLTQQVSNLVESYLLFKIIWIYHVVLIFRRQSYEFFECYPNFNCKKQGSEPCIGCSLVVLVSIIGSS